MSTTHQRKPKIRVEDFLTPRQLQLAKTSENYRMCLPMIVAESHLFQIILNEWFQRFDSERQRRKKRKMKAK